MSKLNFAGASFQLTVFTAAAMGTKPISDEATAIFELFLEREREFGVHPSVVIDYPNLADKSEFGFLSNAGAYAARSVASLVERSCAVRIVVLTTFSDVVGPSLEAAGYDAIAIDMPAGPDQTAAFILTPSPCWSNGRTLYIEAVNEQDEKIRPSFVLKLSDHSGQLCGGACGSIHERDGKRYAYLATMTLASGMPRGSGTALVRQLLQFLRDQNVAKVHLGTQTAGKFYQQNGFKVDHLLIEGLRVRSDAGREVLGDLVMMSMAL